MLNIDYSVYISSLTPFKTCSPVLLDWHQTCFGTGLEILNLLPLPPKSLDYELACKTHLALFYFINFEDRSHVAHACPTEGGLVLFVCLRHACYVAQANLEYMAHIFLSLFSAGIMNMCPYNWLIVCTV